MWLSPSTDMIPEFNRLMEQRTPESDRILFGSLPPEIIEQLRVEWQRQYVGKPLGETVYLVSES